MEPDDRPILFHNGSKIFLAKENEKDLLSYHGCPIVASNAVPDNEIWGITWKNGVPEITRILLGPSPYESRWSRFQEFFLSKLGLGQSRKSAALESMKVKAFFLCLPRKFGKKLITSVIKTRRLP